MSSNAASRSTTTTTKPLSCASCRQRKIKCDRTNPCLPCQTAGIECITPNRVRATRNGKQKKIEARDAELLRRIARLESLVSKTDAAKALRDAVEKDYGTLPLVPEPVSSAPSWPTPEQSVPPPEPQPVRVDSHFEEFVKHQETGCKNRAPDFWSGLAEEVGGLRHLIEHHHVNEDDEPEDANLSSTERYESSPDFIFGSPSDTSIEMMYPSDAHRDLLFKLYFGNIHNVCKILHKPTFDLYRKGALDLVDDKGRFKFKSIEGVTFAMYFAAVMSITAEDCWNYFNEDRNSLLAQYQRSTEIALRKANVMDTSEIVTLQALVLYIMTLRTLNKTRASWTLIALAIRIAQNLRIHRDGDGLSSSVFEAEMRRRLWWEIVVLDIRGTEDRISDPMILEDSFNTRMPCNVNDADFPFPNAEHPARSCVSHLFGHDVHQPRLTDKQGITEMTFCRMVMEMSVTIRKINFVPPTKQNGLTLQEKEALVREFANKIETQYLNGFDPVCSFSFIIYMFGRLVILKLWLAIQYPLQSRKEPTAGNARGQSLRTAVSLLTVSDMLEENGAAAGLRWYFESHVPWHAVAVALVELCRETQGPLADEAWSVLDKSFDKWDRRMSGTKEGMAWLPMRGLRRKAVAARESGLSTVVSPTVSQPNEINAQFQDNNILPELPGLSLEANEATFNNAPAFINLDTMEQVPYQPLGFDVFPSGHTGVQGVDMGVDAVNWDDWNAFVFDANATGSDLNDLGWGLPMQM